MKLTVPILFLFSLPFIPVGCVRSGASCLGHLPRFALEPGARYDYRLSETNEVLADEGGDRVWLHHNLYLDLHCSREKPGAPVQVTCDTFALHQDSPTLEINLDSGSASESTDPHSRMFGAYQGANWTCQVDGHGRVSGLRGFDEVFRKMDELGDGADRSDWKGKFDAGYFTGILNQGWYVNPGGSIGVGDSWTQMDSMNSDNRIPLRTTYTVLRARDGIVYVQTMADVDLRGYRPEGLPHKGSLTLRGTQRGFITLDAATGQLLSRYSTLRAKGDLRSDSVDPQGQDRGATHPDQDDKVVEGRRMRSLKAVPLFLHSVYTLNFVHS